MNYIIKDLELLAAHGVALTITAADVLQLVETLQGASRRTPEMIPLGKAAEVYHKCRKTIKKYINDGLIRGEMLGGEWMVETPEARAARLML